jgi:hypothetical protein
VNVKINTTIPIMRNEVGFPRHLTRHRPARAAARALVLSFAALATALALTACGGNGTVATSPGAGQNGNGQAAAARPDAETAAIVACYRSHGDPGFPNPVYDPNDGRWHFAVSPGSAPASTQRACQHLFPSVNASPPVPQPQFQALVRLAECIRSHGVPNWPDPDPDGSFGLPPALQTKAPGWVHASEACKNLFPAGGIDAHAVS